MSTPRQVSLSNLLATIAGAVGIRAGMTILTGGLALSSICLLIAAGLRALSDTLGFPVAGLVVSTVVALVALTVHPVGQALMARRRAQAADARCRGDADLAAALSRSAAPLLPLAAFLAAYFLSRRS